jgi:hypothetical protein
VHGTTGAEVSPVREGGGRIDLVQADNPLVFAQPTALPFSLVRPRRAVTRTLHLTDAGGGAGMWNVSTTNALATVRSTVTAPGTLSVRVFAPRQTAEADMAGFIVLTRGSDTRRIPLWFRVERPRLPLDGSVALRRPGSYRANTARGHAHVSTYRYPDIVPGDAPFSVVLRGPEVVYRVRLRRPVANLGVAVTSVGRGVRVDPRIVRGDDENRLAGYAALPFDENPYQVSAGRHRPVAGVVLPGAGLYSVVFDTPKGGRPGPFTFRYWQNDTTPPSVRVTGVSRRAVQLAVSDRGSGVDPTSLVVRVDGATRGARYAGGRVTVPLNGIATGRHSLSVTVSDFQETKNMENVPQVLPNTRVLTTAVVVP